MTSSKSAGIRKMPSVASPLREMIWSVRVVRIQGRRRLGNRSFWMSRISCKLANVTKKYF